MIYLPIISLTYRKNQMKPISTFVAVLGFLLLILTPHTAVAGSSPVEATYKQVRRCRTVPGSEARSEYYGWISAAGQTIHLSRDFDATGPTQSCRYETDFSEREITNPSKFN